MTAKDLETVMAIAAEQQRIAEEKAAELRDALHLAYDWMGREPEDAWDKAHFKAAVQQVVKALSNLGVEVNQQKDC